MDCFKIFFSTLLLLGLFTTQDVGAQIISEVFFASSNKQWVEIYNNSNEDIDLTKYRILDSGATVNGHSISISSNSGMLPIGAYGVIARDTRSVNARYLFKSALGLKTGGDTIVLKYGNTTLDSITLPDTSSFSSSSYQNTDNGWVFAIPTPGVVNSSAIALINIFPDTYSSDTSSSVHYSAIPISSVRSVSALTLGAGRDRVVTVGSPVEFRAETNLARIRKTNFLWNFGDGNEGYGEIVTHSYQYPGEYTVVLSASFRDGLAFARSSVQVIDPEISITIATPQRIEIKNNFDQEINLVGRALVSGEKYFVFPQDTIIKGNQAISFSSRITGLKPSNINDVYLIALGNINVPNLNIGARIEDQKQDRILYLTDQLDTLIKKFFAEESS